MAGEGSGLGLLGVLALVVAGLLAGLLGRRRRGPEPPAPGAMQEAERQRQQAEAARRRAEAQLEAELGRAELDRLRATNSLDERVDALLERAGARAGRPGPSGAGGA